MNIVVYINLGGRHLGRRRGCRRCRLLLHSQSCSLLRLDLRLLTLGQFSFLLVSYRCGQVNELTGYNTLLLLLTLLHLYG